jgi:hypothetical protein
MLTLASSAPHRWFSPMQRSSSTSATRTTVGCPRADAARCTQCDDANEHIAPQLTPQQARQDGGGGAGRPHLDGGAVCRRQDVQLLQVTATNLGIQLRCRHVLRDDRRQRRVQTGVASPGPRALRQSTRIMRTMSRARTKSTTSAPAAVTMSTCCTRDTCPHTCHSACARAGTNSVTPAAATRCPAPRQKAGSTCLDPGPS